MHFINVLHLKKPQFLLNNGVVDSLKLKYLESNGINCEKMNPTIHSKIIFGVECTMKQLHKRNISHVKLKPSNVFLDENLDPIIGLPYCIPDTNTIFNIHLPPGFYSEGDKSFHTDSYSFENIFKNN